MPPRERAAAGRLLSSPHVARASGKGGNSSVSGSSTKAAAAAAAASTGKAAATPHHHQPETAAEALALAESIAEQTRPKDEREALAIELLVAGRPRAFCAFFELTAAGGGGDAAGRADSGSSSSLVDEQGSTTGAAPAASGSSSEDPGGDGSGAGDSSSSSSPPLLPHSASGVLALLSAELSRADAAEAAGDARAAFAAHRALGRFFAARRDAARAAAFFARCRAAARRAAWREGELEAGCALGLALESLGRVGAAAACHERCLALALEAGHPGGGDAADGAGAGDGDGGGSDSNAAAAAAAAAAAEARADEARRALVHVYAQQAARRERAGDLGGAEALLCKCLSTAERCGDAAAAGAASHRLGLLAAARGRWEDAARLQAAYMRHSEEGGCGAAARGAACRAYAQCLERLGDSEGAVAALEAHLMVREAELRGGDNGCDEGGGGGGGDDGDERGLALAHCQLGCLRSRRGELDAAVADFERFFEAARALEPRLLAVARANLGAARAAVALRARNEAAAAAAALPVTEEQPPLPCVAAA